MQIGFGAPVSGSWATPANQIEIAQRAEALGYSTLWTYSRILFPDAPEGQRLTAPYRSVHDPLVIAAFLAGFTRRIRLGLAVVNLPFYSPLVLAKALTSIDVISGGRLDAGLGLGWSPEEFEAVGAELGERGARAQEYVACLRAIWTDDPVEWAGRFYSIPRGWVDPKPVQRPCPPILLGGTAEPALVRVGRIADGWISSSRVPGSAIPAHVATIRTAAAEAGRDPASVRIIVRGSMRLRDTDQADDPTMTGTVGKIRADLDAYHEAGVDEVFLDLNFDEQIGNPDADPVRSMAVARDALDTFAPQPH
ncbi:MAG TPA: TIGR03619 family F420-dependent LLM class oxidoreductase [Mycobacteriales bacterium]|nr:TIGR03619 family F420-dependent LLM class oxidoreductase [Mycobacteriales bacterium]